MNAARICIATALAFLLCGASKPGIETSIVLAKPIKIVKFIEYTYDDVSDPPDDLPPLQGNAVYLVKMKTISVSQGTFSQRTFNAYVKGFSERHVLSVKEWAVTINLVKGKYEIYGTSPIRRSFCGSDEYFSGIDVNPAYLYSQTSAKGFTLDTKCYDIH